MINAAGLGHLRANIPHPSCFLPFCLHADTKTVPSTTQKVLNANLMWPRGADQRRFSTAIKIHALYSRTPSKLHRLCSLLVLTVDTLCVSVWTGNLTFMTHTRAQTHTRCTERRKMRSRERRSLKFQGDIGEERGASGRGSRGAGLPGNWPHQYENEPAVTVAAVRLPWHFGCLEDMELQGSTRV